MNDDLLNKLEKLVIKPAIIGAQISAGISCGINAAEHFQNYESNLANALAPLPSELGMIAYFGIAAYLYKKL